MARNKASNSASGNIRLASSKGTPVHSMIFAGRGVKAAATIKDMLVNKPKAVPEID